MEKILATTKRRYEVSQTHEISVDWNGYNFLVIFGNHINGWFIAIPNWNVCIESAHPADVFYNREKLAKALNNIDMAEALADTLSDYWETIKDA